MIKILGISDTHLGRKIQGQPPGDVILSEARRLALQERPEVILFGGDLVEPGTDWTLEKGLEHLRAVASDDGTQVLWVIGNNDLGMVPPEEMENYAEVLDWIATPYDVHVLDHRVAVVDEKVVIIGNYGGEDGSLWKPDCLKSPAYPSTREAIREAGEMEAHEAGVPLTPTELFDRCQAKLQGHLMAAWEGAPHLPLVICTHTVPDSRMLLYGHNAEYDFRNAVMGWEDSEFRGDASHPDPEVYTLSREPNLVAQFCGHTHRPTVVKRPDCPDLVNLSGGQQPRIFTVRG